MPFISVREKLCYSSNSFHNYRHNFKGNGILCEVSYVFKVSQGNFSIKMLFAFKVPLR